MNAKIKSKEELLKKLEESVANHFEDDSNAKYFYSPSSIILLGDHTQYNDGIIISVSLNSYIGIAIRKIKEGFSIIYDDIKYTSPTLNEFEFPLEEKLLLSLGNLFKHIGKEELIKGGFECIIVNGTSRVFGLGNHAAITVGFLNAVNTIFSANFSNTKLVEIAVESESELFGGVVSKPLYYSPIAHRENTFLYYDIRSDFKKFQFLNENIRLVVVSTGQEKENFHEKCKERIEECEVGVKGLRLYIWGIKNLRDVEEKFLERHVHMLPKRLYSRCLYNVVARKTVEEAYKHLRYQECEKFAAKLNETHKNLSEIYDISTERTDKLIKIAEDSGLALGSKMVSCSYHDSTINLVYQKDVEKFSNFIRNNYSQNGGADLHIDTYIIPEGSNQYKKGKKVLEN